MLFGKRSAPRSRPLRQPNVKTTSSIQDMSSSNSEGSCWLPGCWFGESCDQGGNERAKQGFAATACVVHDLEEAEIERQLLLRETPVRAEPGTQQRPEPLDGIDVHLAEAVAILVA